MRGRRGPPFAHTDRPTTTEGQYRSSLSAASDNTDEMRVSGAEHREAIRQHHNAAVGVATLARIDETSGPEWDAAVAEFRRCQQRLDEMARHR